MSQNTVLTAVTAPLTDRDVAWGKARIHAPLTLRQRRLVALELAERAYNADTDQPSTGSERRVLTSIAVTDWQPRFAALCGAYADHRRVEANVDEWRHETDPPMSRERAAGYVLDRLNDALDELIALP